MALITYMPASLTSVINFHKCTSNEKTLLDLSHSTFDKGTQSIKVTPPIKVTLFHVTRGEGGFQVACICKKNFLDHKISKLLFLYKRSYYIVIAIYWEGLLTTFLSHYGFCLLSKPTPPHPPPPFS